VASVGWCLGEIWGKTQAGSGRCCHCLEHKDTCSRGLWRFGSKFCRFKSLLPNAQKGGHCCAFPIGRAVIRLFSRTQGRWVRSTFSRQCCSWMKGISLRLLDCSPAHATHPIFPFGRIAHAVDQCSMVRSLQATTGMLTASSHLDGNGPLCTSILTLLVEILFLYTVLRGNSSASARYACVQKIFRSETLIADSALRGL
jgi:hypothetical protein